MSRLLRILVIVGVLLTLANLTTPAFAHPATDAPLTTCIRYAGFEYCIYH